MQVAPGLYVLHIFHLADNLFTDITISSCNSMDCWGSWLQTIGCSLKPNNYEPTTPLPLNYRPSVVCQARSKVNMW